MSLVPPSPAVLLADSQWTSSDEHTCSRMKTTSPYGYTGSLRGTCPTSAQTSNWHSETQSPPYNLVRAATMSRDKDEHGVICKTRLHVGLFQRRYNGTYTQARGHQLTVWWESFKRHYIRCSGILIRTAVGLTAGLGLDGDWCIRVIPRQLT